MPSTSWFSLSPFNKTSSSTYVTKHEEEASNSIRSLDDPANDIPFDDIVTRFQNLVNEVAHLRKECLAQQKQIQEYAVHLKTARSHQLESDKLHQSQIGVLRNDLNQEKSNTTALQTAIAVHANINLKSLRKGGSIQPFTRVLHNETVVQKQKIHNLEDKITKADHQIGAVERELAQQKLKCLELSNKNAELQLDLEYLMCTTSSHSPPSISNQQIPETNLDAPIPSVPFVLVLVDGDAYQFASMLPNHYLDLDIHPGTRTANNMRTHLQLYITQHNLPPHCNLMVRVLANKSGLKTCKGMGYFKRDEKVVNAIEDFMLRFTESSPLFDFVDAGSGKERVDSKIHELFHTFLPNPHCHKIFLACARDNGFARMLEPYIHHPTSRAKTCLVTAGDIAQEIERLNLETVEWPSVFARQFQPAEVKGKIARRERRQQAQALKVQAEQDNLVKHLGLKGYDELMERRRFQVLTKEMIGKRSVGEVLKDWKAVGGQAIGLRTEYPLKRQSPIDIDGESWGDHDGHGGFCTEVGVD